MAASWRPTDRPVRRTPTFAPITAPVVLSDEEQRRLRCVARLYPAVEWLENRDIRRLVFLAFLIRRGKVNEWTD
jgi:hypothetical protein